MQVIGQRGCGSCAHLAGHWAPRAHLRSAALHRSASGRRSVKMEAGAPPEERNDNDFGARDPTAGELESNFTDRVLGNFDTLHHIRGPDGMKKVVGLATKKCTSCGDKDAKPFDSEAANKWRNQVPGWQIVKTADGHLSLRQDWKVRNFKAGLELFQRVAVVAEEEGHHPDLHLEGWNKVYAVLSTHSIGGLTENDFIMAAKINALEFADLMPKKQKRYWA